LTVETLGGDDTVYDFGAGNTVDLGAGDDEYVGTDADGANVVGGLGDDVLDGSPGDDTLDGGDGDDEIFGNVGDDTLNGGDGIDQLSGGVGDDSLYGEGEGDSIYGGANDDIVVGGDGVDSLDGGFGLNQCDYTGTEVRTETCVYDDAAPDLEFTITPSTVNVTSAARTITISGTTSDTNGIWHFGIGCQNIGFHYNPIGNQTAWQLEGLSDKSDFATISNGRTTTFTNTASDFTLNANRTLISFTVTITIPRGTAPYSGTCFALARDMLGNSSYDDVGNLVIVNSNPNVDTVGPVAAVQFDRARVNSADGSQQFTLSGSVTDQSGVDSFTITCGSLRVMWERDVNPNSAGVESDFVSIDSGRMIGGTWGYSFEQDSVLVSPDNQSVTFTIPLRPAPGLKPFTSQCFFNATDSMGNGRGEEIANSPTIEVVRTGSGYDDFAPEVELTLTDSIVDVGATDQSVTFTGTVLDPSGIERIDLFCGQVGFSWSLRYGTSDLGQISTSSARGSGSGWLDARDFEVTISENLTSGSFSITSDIEFAVSPSRSQCRVEATDRIGNVEVSFLNQYLTINRTPAGMPTGPPGVTYQSADGIPTAGTLSWDAPTFLGSPALRDYQIQFSLSNGNAWTTFNDGFTTTRSLPLSNLKADTLYWFRVRGDNGGNSIAGSPGASWSEILEVRTPAPRIADAPTSPTVTKITGNSATFSWNAPTYDGGSKISTFDVELSRNDGVTWTAIPRNPGTSTKLSVKGLLAGINYRARIAAVNGVGTSYSTEFTFTTLRGKATKPENVVVSAVSSRNLELNWNLPLTNGGYPISNYVVEISSNRGKKWKTVPKAVSTSRSIQIVNLQPNKSYWFKVTAVTSAGLGAASLPLNVVTLDE
jgi:hypothetical protein